MLRKIEAKLLIVDDLPENLLALAALIQGEERSVFQASNADQALALLLEHEFALAILDVQIPGLNGFELAELMRSTEKTKQIPIVFVSAADRELDYAFKGYESGAVDFLHKPLSPHEVRSKVSVFVELYRQRKALLCQLESLEHSRREQEALLSELRATQSELHQAVRMRDDFMSIISHELRTPLNGLMLETQLRKVRLEQNNTEAFTLDKLRVMNERDERQLQSLTRLIEDMLDASRIRTGKLSIRPQRSDLAALVRRVVENLAAHIANATGTVEVHAPEPVLALVDEFRIEQVIANLLTNALRYGADQPVHVTVHGSPQGAWIEVRDQGIGISSADQPRIFQQYERVDGTGVRHGLGLGLFITKQIIGAHGGKIELHSEPGKGSCFSVWLPEDGWQAGAQQPGSGLAE
ncbi:hybrid sensor histidine kinase/response regulator [Pseudomonas sp. LS44]|uniref:hybrid sensor histidine kinase/response regulator n=1 Tax=Pseudomonas sp. LS44 TaxID=1357074 RepID=UPI00215A400B|nr:hybrid sensor histidine kinase/response regulator [Pseudomonas sp. LS44]UVE17914.1 hybrid sensor histidine kinase/response regulator [Pseudomonas sp. LS44]